MNDAVDERIVEMRFDNRNFEKNVQVSLKTLAELNKSLKLDNAGKSFESLQKASSKFDLSNISNNVQIVADRFSFLGIAGDEAIRRLTNAFMDLNVQIAQTVKSLTIDQVGVGFDKYERKVQSVQTIMNATGKSIDEVSLALDKLNWFTDETSYSYADMVDNISKFTSSNVALDTAVTSMIGIANAAGLAGVNTQDASHAMEGFSKAIAQGYMSRQNWQWIRTAHMDTTKFKDILIQAAEAEGTLTKQLDGTWASLDGTTVSIEDFETALKDGWMTTKVINKALHEFGGTTEEIYKEYQRLDGQATTSDIIKNMGMSVDDLGLKSFRAAQEAKTFADAINSVKDAVSTGWMVSFEKIFGNYEEARVFWTDVANEMWDIFASGGESRNDILSSVFNSGAFNDFRAALTESGVSLDQFEDSLRKVVESAGMDVVDLVEEYGSLAKAFRAGAIDGNYAKQALRGLAEELSGTTKETVDLDAKLEEIKGKVKEVIAGEYGNGDARKQALEELGYSYEYIQGLVNKLLLEGKQITIDDVKIFEKEIETLNGITEEQKEALLAFVDGTDEANAAFDELVNNMSKKTGQELVHEMILNLLDGIIQVQEAFREASATVFGSDDVRATLFSNALEKLHDLTEQFILSDESAENLQKSFEGLLSIFKFFGITFRRILTILSPIRELFDISGDSILEFTGNLGEGITKYVEWYESSEEMANTTENLRQKVETIVTTIKNAIRFVKELAEEYLPVITKKLSELKTRISTGPIGKLINKVNNGLRKLWRYITNIDTKKIREELSKLRGHIRSIWNAISEFYNGVRTFLAPYIDKIRDVFTNLGDTIASLSDKFAELKSSVDSSGGIFQFILNKLKEAKKAVTDFLNKGGFSSMFDGFVEGFEPIRKRFSDFLKGLKDSLSELDLSEVLALTLGFSLVPMVLSISAAFGEAAKLFKTGKGVLGGISTILTKFKNGFKTTVAEIAGAAVEFAIAIAILAGAIWLLANKVDPAALKNVTIALIEVMGAFAALVLVVGAVSKWASKDLPKVLTSMLALAASIGIIVAALYFLQDVKLNVGAIVTVAGLMVGLLAVAGIMQRFGIKLEGIGWYFLTFAGAVLLLAVAMERLGNIPLESMDNAMEAITNLMLGLIAVSAVSTFAKGSGFGIFAMLGGVYLLIKLFNMLADSSMDSIIQAAEKNWAKMLECLAWIGVIGMLGGASGGGVSFNPNKTGVGLLLITASLLVLVEAIKRFADLPVDAIEKSKKTILSVLGLFALLALASGWGSEGGDAAKEGVAIAIMAGSLFLIYLAMKKFATLKPSAIGKGLAILTVVFTLYAGLLLSLAATKNAKTGPIIAMIVLLAAVAAAIAVLSLFKWEDMAGGVAAMGVVLVALAVVFGTLSKIEFSDDAIFGLVGMVGMLFAIGYNLAKLAEFSWESLTAAVTAIAGCLAAVIITMYTLKSMNFGPLELLAAAGALLIGLAAVFVIGLILQHLGEFTWSGHVATATAISEVLLAVAVAMRVVAGIDVGAALEGALALGAGLLAVGVALSVVAFIATGLLTNAVADSITKLEEVSTKLPTIGENIAKLCGYLADIPPIDPNIGKTLEAVGIGMLAITAADFIESIKKFFGGEDPFEGMEGKMTSLGKGLTALANNTPSGDALDRVVIALNSMSSIADIIKNIPPNTQWDSIKNNLEKFGETIYFYSYAVEGTNIEAIVESKNAVEYISDIVGMLPTSGGLVGILFNGKTDWKGINENLSDFGTAIYDYSKEVYGTNLKAIEDSVPAVEYVSKIADMLPTTGGLIGLFTGETDWDGLNNNLAKFGGTLLSYALAVTALPPQLSNIQATVTATGYIAQVAANIANSTALMSLINDDVNLKFLGEQLVAYGRSIKEFGDIAGEVEYGNIQKFADLKLVGIVAGETIVKGILGEQPGVISAIDILVAAAVSEANRSISDMRAIGGNMANAIGNGLRNSVKVVSGAIDPYKAAVSNDMASIVGSLSDAFETEEPEVRTATENLMRSITDKMRSYYSTFESTGGYLSIAFGYGLRNGTTSSSYVTGMLNDGIIAIRSYYTKYYNAAYYIVNGLANGVYDYSYLATDAIGYMSRSMNQTFRNINRIQSPSKLYEDWARYIPMGAAKGIENGTPVAENAVEGMGADMIAAISPALSILSRLVNGEFEISPTIRPVVDMTDVYASSELMRSLLDYRSDEARNTANYISGNMRNIDTNRLSTNDVNTRSNSEMAQPVINNYIYTQPGQDTAAIADEVERRMVRSLTQKRVAFVNR